MVVSPVSKLVAQPELVESIPQRERPWYYLLSACFFSRSSVAVPAEPVVVAEPVAPVAVVVAEPVVPVAVVVAEPVVAAEPVVVAEPVAPAEPAAVDPEDDLYVSSSE